MSDELKPVRCGCGGEAKVCSYLSREDCAMVYYVRCEKCGTETEDLPSEAEAIEAWNKAMGKRTKGEWTERKVYSDIVIQDYQSAKCSVCGKYHTTPYQYYFDNYKFCPNCGADMRGEHDTD